MINLLIVGVIAAIALQHRRATTRNDPLIFPVVDDPLIFLDSDSTVYPRPSGNFEPMREIMKSTSTSTTKIDGVDPGVYADTIRAAASTYDVPVGLLARLLWTESRFRADAVNPTSGARGIAQFMPATAREYGVDVMDPISSINGAAKYLRWLYTYLGQDWVLAVAGYNYGPGNVKRKGLAGIRKVPETVAYVKSILGVDVNQIS